MMNSYQLVTDAIVEKLKQGVIPWRRPWTSNNLGDCRNLDSLRKYSGINAILTAMQGFESPYFLTKKQAESFGATIKPDAKGTPIAFYSRFKKENEDGEEKQIGFLKHFLVFNASQCDGLKQSIELIYPNRNKTKNTFKAIQTCEVIANEMPQKPTIQHKLQMARYSPKLDYINMPLKESFESAETYYATLFHELSHSTGHETRLNRKTLTDMNASGSHSYSKEELVAELSSAFLCKESGIDAITIDQSASYIHSWTKILKGNPKLIVYAASQAQKASNFILNRKAEK